MIQTMPCTQLGGPCDLGLSGETANEVIKAQDKHLQTAVAAGDYTHAAALQAMKGRWKRPLSGISWYCQTKRDFAALPSS